MTAKANLGASVMARLLNRAKETGDDYQTLLVAYCFERFLYRLGISPIRDRFVLKGAMLLRVWSDQPYRSTRDLDLLRRGDGSRVAIVDDLRSVVSTPATDDGVEFDGRHIRLEAIRAEDEYAGTRARLPARCGTARLTLQIDMGLGDSVWPAPQRCKYPPLLDLPAPDVFAYPREAVVAEKLEAIVVLGDRNSRIKDFFDLHYLATHFEFDQATLVESVRRTFEQRSTPIPPDKPIGLTPAYWENPSRPAQVRAFAKRAGLTIPKAFADDLARVLSQFLSPILSDLLSGVRHDAKWAPGGPWR
jgi:hypothetical protein